MPRAVSPAEGLDDAQLVAAARKGDRNAFEALYHLYARMVAGIVLARVAPDEVPDLVQDVFLQAIARLHTLRDPRAFGGWLATIARNRVADHHRRSTDLAELPNDLSTYDPDRSEALSILAVVQSLPDAYRETLILR
ncbi:MAG: RNA polymerase sigma factor, partial [Acidimicrobiia bacterium]